MSNSIPLELIDEGSRVMRICNACRYCEGFCAVFPALERRLDFLESDVNYLANLCHDCGECYYCCQYAPPHEFALNFPRTLAQIRQESFRKYAWPHWAGAIFQNNRVALLLGALGAPFLFLLLTVAFVPATKLYSAHSDSTGSFYQVMPHAVMISVFSIVGLFVFAALVTGLIRFWRETGEPAATLAQPAMWWRAVSDTMHLRYLDGGASDGAGDGCAYPTEIPSHTRRWFHHLTFYGFLLCLAATTVAAIYHNFLGWEAPYPWLSAPVILGSLGGVGLLVGPAGLLWLKARRDAELTYPPHSEMDIAFLVMLLLVSLTGFLLLLLRETSAMGVVLAVHLGTVLGLLLTMPYGKFVHGVYRFGALLRNAREEMQERAGKSRSH